MRLIVLIMIVILPLATAGCAGGDDRDTSAEKASTASRPDDGKGVGPVTSVDIATLDTSLASAGATVFQEKCTACHKLEERYIGPALDGVTTRRKPEWIMNMMLNPDVMVKKDETAKALLAEYLAPMTNQNLTVDEARSVLAFLLENDSQTAE